MAHQLSRRTITDVRTVTPRHMSDQSSQGYQQAALRRLGLISFVSGPTSRPVVSVRVSPPYGPIAIAIRARFEYDSSSIRLQHATTRYEVFRALAYEIVYGNQW